ncbi:MAG TPA: cupin domain-containing protein [Candidatus Nitrosotenuis sp.]|nr:cupin domain-containing protein [Candidatus Nitrosotenuis sp.]
MGLKLEFDIKKYIEDLKASEDYFHTFIDRDNLAAGVLLLEPGEEDTQEPHSSDELYYVIQGDGFLKIDNKDYSISEGKVYFVQKNIPHKFFGNKKPLVVLYFFSGSDS